MQRRSEFAAALSGSRERFSETAMIASYSALIDRIQQDRPVRRTRRGDRGVPILTRG